MNNLIIEFDDVSFVYKANNETDKNVNKVHNNDKNNEAKKKYNEKSNPSKDKKDQILGEEYINYAVKGINLSITQGEFIAVVGKNGSGKSTFAKLINALILPTSGEIFINGMNTKEKGQLWNIRQQVGMVFQNPENQIVATSVEEDVAFGPENLGIVPNEIRKRVDEALKVVGLFDYCEFQPGMLSGGQKQKVAIAGILAMKPKCIILDESTSMLDPSGRKEILTVIRNLNRNENITVIHVTHNMDEVCLFDRAIVFEKGSIIRDDTPKKILSDVETIKSLGLDVPQIVELFYQLNKNGLDFPLDIFTVSEAVNCLKNYL